MFLNEKSQWVVKGGGALRKRLPAVEQFSDRVFDLLSDTLRRTKEDAYGHAWNYEALFANDLREIPALLEALSGPSEILDMGGGTGRLSIPLVCAGHSVNLVDKSHLMLAESEVRSQNLNESELKRLKIIQADLRDYVESSRFDMALLVNHTLEHLSSIPEILKALVSLRCALRENGHVFLTVHNLAYWHSRESWKTGVWRYHGKQSGFPFWERTSSVDPMRVLWQHRVWSSGAFVHLQSLLIHLDQTKWERCFIESGFEVKNCWGDWDKRPVDKNTARIVYQLRIA